MWGMEMTAIPLTATQREHVRTRIASGDFASEGDYIQWLVALDLDRVQRLRDALQEGLDSGISDRSIEQIFQEAIRRNSEADA